MSERIGNYKLDTHNRKPTCGVPFHASLDRPRSHPPELVALHLHDDMVPRGWPRSLRVSTFQIRMEYWHPTGRGLEGPSLDRLSVVSTTITNGWLLDVRRYGSKIVAPQAASPSFEL